MSDFESEEMGWRYWVDALTTSNAHYRVGEKLRIPIRGTSVSVSVLSCLVRPCGKLCELFVLMYVDLD